jgi:aspartate racemase
MFEPGSDQMKTIGLIGGMSWESTATYYELINRGIADRLGGLHSARIAMWSVDFAEIESAQVEGRWEDAGAALAEAARSLERAGADFLVLATNTMHKVADEIDAAAHLPLLHIGEVTGRAIQDAGLPRVGLLGTRFTMEQQFYREVLEQQFGLDVLVPEGAGVDTINDIIYDELCKGRIDEGSRRRAAEVIAGLVERGARGVVLGCTELPLLIRPEDASVPLFDTTRLHAEAAVARALE